MFNYQKLLIKSSLVFCLNSNTIINYNSIKSKGIIIQKGQFYSLQAAFDQGFLNKKDLEEIKIYKNPSDLNNLDELLLNQIKNDFIKAFPRPMVGIKDVHISKYYGQYQGCLGLMIDYMDSVYLQKIWSETIGDVEFNYRNSQRILVYKF